MARKEVLPEVDSLIHEPARLRVLALLTRVDEADFMFILRQTGLSRGNLSVQMTRLEEAGIVALKRELNGARVRTSYRLTPTSRDRLAQYRATMEGLLAGLPRGP